MVYNPHAIPAVVNAISGAIGGTFASFCLFPLDLVTTRLQVQESTDSKDDVSTKPHYDGMTDAFKQIYRDHGLAEFYEGVLSDCSAVVMQAFLYFLAYDYIRNRHIVAKIKATGRVPRMLSSGEELLIGSEAGIICKGVIIPLNNIVIRQQTASLNDSRDMTALQCAKEIYRERGITGFWTGYKAIIFLSLNPSLTYYFYQVLVTKLVSRRKRSGPSTMQVFIFAAIAKCLATILTYPVILAKTRLQAQKTQRSLLAILYQTMLQEGAPGLFKGIQSQLLKGFFSQGITMMTKDQCTRLSVRLYRAALKRNLVRS